MYNIILYIYAFGAWVLSFFNDKVKKMIVGQRQTYGLLQQAIHDDDRVVWFHCASLGEFEQGRPIIERLRAHHPEYTILLTFFSPSGYEVRKNYEGADLVCYLPFDTPRRARRFLRLAHPEVALFIKYEFWQNYLVGMRRRGTRLYSISSIFRPQQHFFRWWGNSRPLRQFTHLFVQNEASRQLLHQAGIDNVTVTGDTRFDRVIDIRRAASDLPVVRTFLDARPGHPVFIAGSSWEPDEAIYIPYFGSHPDWTLIIAPHVIAESHLQSIETLLDQHGYSHIRYTQLEAAQKAGDEMAAPDPAAPAALIVNCFGKLSSIYRYATIALVGGGFGAGIHNVPEAAVYGVPVLFGPNNQKFREAQALLRLGGAFQYTDADTFTTTRERFASDPQFLSESGRKAGEYIATNAGAADACYQAIFLPNPTNP